MRTDKYGQKIYSENDICDLILEDPSRKISSILTDDDIKLVDDIIDRKAVYNIKKYQKGDYRSIEEFDHQQQNNWKIPDKYKDLDIVEYVLSLCKTEVELQRVAEELFLFQDRNMFPLLKYLVYLVDTMREHNIVWGVGRGSSVASYVLYLIGIHRIDSIFYDLSIYEYLK